MILSTHILPEVEAVCDRVQILHRGEVVFNDTIAGLKQFRGGQRCCGRPAQSAAAGRNRAASPADAEVDAVNANLFRVQPRAGTDPTDDAGARDGRARLGAVSAAAGAGQPGGSVRAADPEKKRLPHEPPSEGPHFMGIDGKAMRRTPTQNAASYNLTEAST